MIFIFRHYDSQKRIIIYAESYLEAKEALFEFNPYADKTYNILEYKKYEVDKLKYGEILNLDIEMLSYPRILSEKEFETICSSPEHIINDKAFNDIHNTKVLTKSFAGEDTILMSTSEFVNALKENADHKQVTKKQIKKMLSIVGDIWKLTYTPYRYTDVNGVIKDTASIYGLSRCQILEMYNNQPHKQGYEKLTIEPIIQPNYREVFELETNDFSQKDIDEYNMLVNYMKKYNIKKFPFDTQEQDIILLKEKAGNLITCLNYFKFVRSYAISSPRLRSNFAFIRDCLFNRCLSYLLQ